MKSRIEANCRQVVRRIREKHLRRINDSQGDVFYISDTYPGVWLEHTYDPLVWAALSGETAPAVNQTALFLSHQKEDGQLPYFVGQNKIGYSQLQECVSCARLCLEVYGLTGVRNYLADIYRRCAAWDDWLCQNRMGKTGMIEMYCGFDSGHDNSGRLDGMKYHGKVSQNAADLPVGCPVAPIVAPDLNAVFYGGRMALADMATELGLQEESAAWKEKAADIHRKLFAVCRDPEDGFFYDVDKNGQLRRCKSISITAMFCERVFDQAQADDIFDRYFRNEKEFGTPFPYSSVSAADPVFEKRMNGNSWGYYSQGLTMLRTLRWMKHYGYEQELHDNMEKWLYAWTESPLPFGQELDPFTGAPSQSSAWYSSTMLFYLYSARELGCVSQDLLMDKGEIQ